MELYGVDLDGLAHEAPALDIPDAVKGRIVHIDADFLAYQCSAESKTEFKSFEDMKHNADIAIETLRALAGAEYVHLHLTPFSSNKGNRYSHALLKEYQANRKNKEKPKYLHVMRQYLAQKYHGKMHERCEADDGMSSSQYAAIARGERNLSIICSKDKDLDMVPGLHLDWDRGCIKDTGDDFGRIWLDDTKSTKKLKGLGQKFFWAQMLMGDTADNISGIPKLHSPYYEMVGRKSPSTCGPAGAFKLLDEARSNKEAFDIVKSVYKCYPSFVDWRTGAPISWADAFWSEARLLWMRRDKEDEDDVKKWVKEIVNG